MKKNTFYEAQNLDFKIAAIDSTLTEIENKKPSEFLKEHSTLDEDIKIELRNAVIRILKKHKSIAEEKFSKL
jgi:hypothetical protein